MTVSITPTTTVSRLDYYHIIRGQIEHEDNLISSRLSWFIASQSFLFTAYAIIANGIVGATPAMTGDPRRRMLIIIPGISAATCLLMFIAILSGAIALHNLRRLYAASVPTPTDSSLPPVQGYRATQAMGLLAPILLPILFLAVWTFLLTQRLF